MDKFDNGNLILRAGNAAYGGLTVSRRADQECTNEHPDKTALIKGAIPGELVEISVNSEKRSHITGDVTKVIEPSPDRITPRCPYFGVCGGCHLQFAEYKQQIKIKESALTDCMQRIAKIDVRLSEALSIESNDWGYRHRGRFKVSGKTIGFSQEKSNNLIAIEQCPLMTTDINNALSVLRQMIAGKPQIFKEIDEICLASNSVSALWYENIAVSFLGKPNMSSIRPDSCVVGASSNMTGARINNKKISNTGIRTDNRNNGKSVAYANNISELKSALSKHGLKRVLLPGYETHENKLQNQKPEPEHDCDFELPLNGTPYGLPYKLRYKVSPAGFFQANWRLNLKMLGKVIDSLKPLENKVVLDIFSGAGNFSLPVALTAKNVIAVEANPTAVFYGRLNAKLNNIDNIEFQNISSQQLPEKYFKNIDAVILDPPRSGIGGNIVKQLLSNPVDTVIYVSCDPATLARDLNLLSGKYTVDSLRLVDMFPQTYHIESLAVLKIKH